jgi:hypothetical protein
MIKKIVFVCLLVLPGIRVGDAYGDPDAGQLVFPDREAEIRYYLAYYGLSPHWVRVARVESGWHHNSYIAREGHNYVGMHAIRRRTTTSIGTVSFYARYDCVQSAMADLRLWSDLNPQRPNESFERWLRRRHWNPNPAYYQYLYQVPLS